MPDVMLVFDFVGELPLASQDVDTRCHFGI